MGLEYLSFDYLVKMIVWLIVLAVSFVVLLRWRRGRKEAKRRLTWPNALLSLWMTLAMLTGLELGVALFYDQTDSFNMTWSSKKWFDKHVRPDQKALQFANWEGVWYRDNVVVEKEHPPDVFRIVFLGDSFTFGHGVENLEDRFSNRVRRKIEAEYPGKFQVLNLADAGTGLHWGERMVQLLIGNGYEIETIVYVVCMNDIETFDPRHRTYYDDLFSIGPSFFPFNSTYLGNLLYFRFKQFQLPDVRNYYGSLQRYYEGQPGELMKLKMKDVWRLGQEAGCEVRFVIFPFLHNLGPDYPFRDAHRQLVEYCESEGIAVLDLAPVLDPHVGEGLTVNPFDAHPNEHAHAIVAEAIGANLLKDVVPQALAE